MAETKTKNKSADGQNGVVRRGPRSPMSDEHKAQLARGRTAGVAVKNYLLALEQVNKPRKRGRGSAIDQMTEEQVQARLAEIDAELKRAGIMEKLTLLAEQEKLAERLHQTDEPIDIESLEKGFIEYGREWVVAKGYSYSMMRTVGVPHQVLEAAGIPRS